MKRRRFVQALVGTSAAASIMTGQQNPVTQTPGPAQPAPGIPLNPTTPIQPPGRAAVMDLPKLDINYADDVASEMPHFFSAAQFSTLQKVSDIIAPATSSHAGALDAKAAEFLDFLISESPADRKEVYRSGLDALNAQAKKRYSKPFADLDPSQSNELMAPLRQQWTYETPSEPVARFLRAAKQDVRTATVNSREYVAGAKSNAGTRRGGGGLYWYPLD